MDKDKRIVELEKEVSALKQELKRAKHQKRILQEKLNNVKQIDTLQK